MLKKPCIRCGNPSRSSPCAICREKMTPPRYSRPDFRPSRQQRGYDAEYEANRAIVVEMTIVYGLPCAICGLPFRQGQTITAEHKIPLRQGGGNGIENLVPAHQRCNSGWRKRRRA